MDRRSKAYGFKESLLPKFTRTEKSNIIGTYDFFGINCYTGALVIADNASTDSMGFFNDVDAILYQPDDWVGAGQFKVVSFKSVS